MSTAQDTERCGNCRFWHEDTGIPDDPDDDDKQGHCRRYPLVLIDSEYALRLCGWEQPLTLEIDWCGEWQAAKGGGPALDWETFVSRLSPRIRKAFRREHIESWENLAAVQSTKLWSYFGKMSLNELVDKMRLAGCPVPDSWGKVEW